MFGIYLKLGFKHILDINAYDHVLFIVALCAIYLIKDWKKVLILVTAFTVGHSLTLALAVLDIIHIPADIIEFLIPVTILITALHNVVGNPDHHSRVNWYYLLALFFGLIHGLGFSNYFKALLGSEERITFPLFAFNVGVELGQIIIVLITLLASYIIVVVCKVKQRSWNLFISGAVAGCALMLMLN